MVIRATTDYSIRVMAFLAKNGGVASSTRIAEQMDIPQKYLIKIAAVLREKGLISSSHGANGGYRLTRPAGEITMRDILMAVEPEMLTGSEDRKPTDDADGIVRKMFNGINEQLEDYFQAISLLDFASNINGERLSKGDDDREEY